MNWRKSFARHGTVAVLSALAIAAQAQQLVVGSSGDYGLSGAGPLTTIADLAAQWDDLGVAYVRPVSIGSINPHGLVPIDRDHALAANAGRNHIDLIDLPSGTVTFSFYPNGPGDFSYLGFGSIAINPAGTHLLLAPGSTSSATQRNRVWVVPLPLSESSTASNVIELPGDLGTAQTRAIVFDEATGRAYIGHSAGITALDAPYVTASIAFTLPLADVSGANFAIGRALSLSPDRQTLLSTATNSGRPVTIVHAPFSATSVSEDLMVSNAVALDASAFLPDGSRVLVVDNKPSNDMQTTQFFAISAPYSMSSVVERMQLARYTSNNGFEDLAISPDGQFAALVGGSLDYTDPLVIARGPFTAAQFRYQALPMTYVGTPYGQPGRGTGSAAFWPQASTIAPQVTINRVSITEGDAGMRAASFTLTLSRPATQWANVDYATENGTATGGLDYGARSGSVSFAPGERQRNVDVQIIGNSIDQSDRWFRLQLNTAINVSVIQASGSRDGEALIVDDDGPKTVILTDSPLPDACLGKPYSIAFQAAGLTAPPAWSINSARGVVSGLTIAPATGVLSGVPASVDQGFINVVVRGTFAEFDTREFALRVRASCDRLFASGFE